MSAFDVDAVIKKVLDLRDKPFGVRGGITDDEIHQILAQVTEVFKKEPSLLELPAPITVCGDIRGQIYELIRIFDKTGYPPETRYLFLGNYGDYHSVDTVCLLFCYKIKYPDRVFMLRGSYDCHTWMRLRGFHDEIEQVYGNMSLLNAFGGCFEWLPFAAIVGEKIFCVHGGISPELESLDDIRRLKRPMPTPEEGFILDLLWTDPDPDVECWDVNEERGISWTYGLKPVQEFLNRFELDLIVRGNQAVMNGYEFPFMPEMTCLTLFSASNHKYEYENRGAVLTIDENLYSSFTVFEPRTYREEGAALGVEDDE